ncbi:hypothetical protein RFI_11386 [Reticulomyxa filosa]|uniref:DH domain-containing protein n=1 Tax=Reticulomyxa filosa TaxID=46433 RepID=X6NIM4_RETFI|nr:hypothetical protein RFI_11386 [Reticulomyxa filosa]|eukprot:ETO25753.1 hypothetical protein RFI_11386 [Reticulomyxa filosa]
MLQFHVNFLSVIRDALNIVPDFYKYSNFVQMYDDYLGKFDSVLQVFAEWKSMQFRSFINMRLENEKVKKCIEAPMLWMLPWYDYLASSKKSLIILSFPLSLQKKKKKKKRYLYHPFERLKVYYKFLRDLESLSKAGDEDRKFLDDSLVKFKKVYQKNQAKFNNCKTYEKFKKKKKNIKKKKKKKTNTKISSLTNTKYKT